MHPLNRTVAMFALVVAPTFAAAAPLPAEVAQALQRERIPQEAVTVLVQEAGTGTTRLSLNANQPMNPASVAKLLTTYAALDELGPAYTWKTPLWFAGPIRGGVLEGNLHLQGRGDPKLTLERVWLALQRIRAMGVNEIRGDIVIDQSAFVVPETSTAEFDNEPLRPYNARSQALLANLSAVIYTFTPDVARGVAMVSAEPLLDGAQVDATVPLGNGPCGDWRGGLKAITGDPQRQSGMRFSGSYPLSCGERFWALAHTDARQYTARLLSTLWRNGGGKLSGVVREGPAPTDAAPTFELTSPPLADVVRDINKYSNNVMAQQVFLTLGLLRNHKFGRHARDPGRRARSAQAVDARSSGRVAGRCGHRQRLRPVARDTHLRGAAGACAATRLEQCRDARAGGVAAGDGPRRHAAPLARQCRDDRPRTPENRLAARRAGAGRLRARCQRQALCAGGDDQPPERRRGAARARRASAVDYQRSAVVAFPSDRRGSGSARPLAGLAGRALAVLAPLARHKQSTGLFVSGLGPLQGEAAKPLRG